MTSLPESLTDARFNLSNHADAPFDPLESSDELVALLDVEGWDCSGISHESTVTTAEYARQKDGSEQPISVGEVVIENHLIEWSGEYPVPGIESSTRSRVLLVYNDHAPQSDPMSDPTPEYAPGYELMGYAHRPDASEPVGYVHGGTYTNLARAIYDAVTMLSHIKDGLLIEDVTPMEQTTQSFLDDLLDEEFDEDDR